MLDHPFAKIFVTCAIMIAVAGMGQATASDRIISAAQMIKANALLEDIHRQDPTRALDIALELQAMIAAADRGGPDTISPQLKYRDTPSTTPSDEGDIKQKNQKDFNENPILRELYSRSPMASLRMLKRLREAAKKNN